MSNMPLKFILNLWTDQETNEAAQMIQEGRIAREGPNDYL